MEERNPYGLMGHARVVHHPRLASRLRGLLQQRPQLCCQKKMAKVAPVTLVGASRAVDGRLVVMRRIVAQYVNAYVALVAQSGRGCPHALEVLQVARNQ